MNKFKKRFSISCIAISLIFIPLLTSCSKKNSNDIPDENLQNNLEEIPKNNRLEEDLQKYTQNENLQIRISGDIPQYNTLEDAKKDGLVVFEEFNITSGQDAWDEFIKKCDKKEEASILLAYYYTSDDASKYSNKANDSEKDEKTVLYIHRLTYNGTEYTIEWYEDEQLITKSYAYIKKYEGQPRSSTAIFSDYVYYVLVNNNSVTWEDIEYGMLSSLAGAYIDHQTVYRKYILKD